MKSLCYLSLIFLVSFSHAQMDLPNEIPRLELDPSIRNPFKREQVKTIERPADNAQINTQIRSLFNPEESEGDSRQRNTNLQSVILSDIDSERMIALGGKAFREGDTIQFEDINGIIRPIQGIDLVLTSIGEKSIVVEVNMRDGFNFEDDEDLLSKIKSYTLSIELPSFFLQNRYSDLEI